MGFLFLVINKLLVFLSVYSSLIFKYFIKFNLSSEPMGIMRCFEPFPVTTTKSSSKSRS